MSLNLAISHLSVDDFAILIKNGRRSSEIYGIDFKSIEHSSYRFVKETLPDLLASGNFDAIIMAAIKDRGFGIFDHDIDHMDINDMMAFVLWIRDEVDSISKMEQEYLKNETDADLIAAGINEMNIFGELNGIDSLAGGDITKHEAIWRLPYGEVFAKQMKILYETRINKRLHKIKTKK